MTIFLYLCRVVSGYDDPVKAGVRLKNQRYALLGVCGKKGNEKTVLNLDSRGEPFVLECLDRLRSVDKEEDS